jgi:hypothetical protein
MIRDFEIVEKFKKGASIDGLTDFIYYQEKADNALRKKDDRTRTTKTEAKHIVESAIYQDLIKKQL